MKKTIRQHITNIVMIALLIWLLWLIMTVPAQPQIRKTAPNIPVQVAERKCALTNCPIKDNLAWLPVIGHMNGHEGVQAEMYVWLCPEHYRALSQDTPVSGKRFWDKVKGWVTKKP